MKKLIGLSLLLMAAFLLMVDILPDKHDASRAAVNIVTQKSADGIKGNDNSISSRSNDGVEAYINNIFEGDQTTTENRNKIFEKIKDINWIKLDKLNENRAFELMEWIGKQALSDSELVSLMNATNGLDAAYTESYCALLGKMCRRDKTAFISAAGKLDSKQLETVCSFTAYDLGYSSNKSFTLELKIYLKSADLSSDEKRAAQALLKAIETGIQ